MKGKGFRRRKDVVGVVGMSDEGAARREWMARLKRSGNFKDSVTI